MLLLDTDICIFWLRQSSETVIMRLTTSDPNDIGVTAITAAELLYGAIHSRNPWQTMAATQDFLEPFRVFPFDSAAAIHYADIKQHLVSRGQLIGTMDVLNAAIARSSGSIFVTTTRANWSASRVWRLRTGPCRAMLS